MSVFDLSIDQAVAGAPRAPRELRRGEIVPMGLHTVPLDGGPSENQEAVVVLHGQSGLACAWELPRVRDVGAPCAVVPHPRHARPAGAGGGGACA